MKDLLGQAILDYQIQKTPVFVNTCTDITDWDELEIAYFFRAYKAMPKLEQNALDKCTGKVLDVGCGAGSHALYLQQKGVDVTAIDISAHAVETAKKRGVKQVFQQDLMNLSGKFDTILLLMNGTGIFQTLAQTSAYLQKLKLLLNPGGQILIDSSDLIYLFDEDEDGSKWIPYDGKYYGELIFTLQYDNQEESFPWLYLDFNTLQRACLANELSCELIAEGENYDYLARITSID